LSLTGKLIFRCDEERGLPKEDCRRRMSEYPEESMMRARKAIDTARALASHVASK
jgi:hypothetical protein